MVRVAPEHLTDVHTCNFKMISFDGTQFCKRIQHTTSSFSVLILFTMLEQPILNNMVKLYGGTMFIVHRSCDVRSKTGKRQNEVQYVGVGNNAT